MPRKSHAPGRDRRLRQRFYDAGNIKCPICLSEFDRSDVLAGTEVTLEHAPPKSLGGAPVCLTCRSCNNKASLVDRHAYLSLKARKAWAAGRGVPIVVDLFGHKRTYRFVPRDPNSPFPARKHLFRNGSIEIGSLPPKEHLDMDKGMNFRIPQRDDYEFVSMIKSAYLMVFSLMGANGYKFAENVGLGPVREQIMNPEKKILKSGFVGTMRLESEDYRNLDRSIIFLCRAANPPFWIVPLWRNQAVLLSCGAREPIDELLMNPKEFEIPNHSLVGWMFRRFNVSAAIAGTVNQTPDALNNSLAGAIGGSIPTSKGKWSYIVVFHQMKEYVALPFCDKDDQPTSEVIHIVDMLSEHEVIGKNLDKSKMASTNIGSWARDFPITVEPLDRVGKSGVKSEI